MRQPLWRPRARRGPNRLPAGCSPSVEGSQADAKQELPEYRLEIWDVRRSAADRRWLVRSLRRSPVHLLAEKVETAEKIAECEDLGFDLFQGYYFARPIVLEGADLDAARAPLIQLLQQISTESEARLIVETLKRDAKLGLNLLRLVNTAARASRVRLETIEGAVRHLGLQQLSRWVAILLYAQGKASQMRSPLLTVAVHRGRLMELIAGACFGTAGDGVESERAFLVGMLSMADALLGRPLEVLVHKLRLAGDIARALTHHEEGLGRLLSMAESIERGEAEKFEPELRSRDLDFDDLQKIENVAYAWLHEMVEATQE